MRKKRVLAVGFFGEGNLGDQAILRGIVSAVGNSASIIATSGNFYSGTEVEVVKRRGFLSWPLYLRELIRADRVIFSGGILQDWSFEGVLFYALRMIAARNFGRKPSLWGAGLGPLQRNLSNALAGKALKAVDVSWLRDLESRETFFSLSGKRGNHGVDWSWGIPYSPESCRKTRFSTGINIRPWFDRRWIIQAGNKAALKYESSAFIGISARREDTRIMAATFPELKIHEPADFTALLELCSGLKEGWAMRYHVLLAMLRCSVPVIPFPYDKKVLSLCKEAGVDTDIGATSFDCPVKARRDFVSDAMVRYELMKTAFIRYMDGSG